MSQRGQRKSDQAGLRQPPWVFSRGDGESWESFEQGVTVFSSPVCPHLSVPRPKHHGEWTESAPKGPEARLQPPAADARAS